MARKRHTAEQIINKLREAGSRNGEGHDDWSGLQEARCF